MLEVKVYKELDRFSLDVELSIESKEYAVVIGKSGAGKSMFAKVVAGIERSDRGKVVLNGKDVTDLPPEKRGISYLSQGNTLFPHMTVLENLEFPLRVRGKRVDRGKIKEISRKFGIGEILKKKPSAISGGEAQRVALVRALLSKPELIILDEPLNSLDFFNKTEVIEFLKKLKGKTTVLHITHDPFEARELGDRVIFFESGKVAFSGSWEEFLELEGELPQKIRSFFPSL